MKTFRDHLKEEVKIGALSSGGIDIEREAIRDEINGILSSIAARPCITPYASLNKIRKALAYFSIFLPKRVYLEGRHGIEVWEVNQFGDKMGVTDQGEWIKHVPAKFYLFFHYHRMGGMYYLEAKIVDDAELEKKISYAESMIAEEMDAAMRQDLAKAKASKEDPHTALGDCDCSQGDSPSTKKAVKVSMKKMDEAKSYYASTRPKLMRISKEDPVKPSAGEPKGDAMKNAFDKIEKAFPKGSIKVGGRKTVKEAKGPCWKGYEMIGMKKKGGREVPNCVPKEETQIDELKKSTVARYEKKAGKQFDKIMDKATDPYLSNLSAAERKTANKRGAGLKMAADRLEETQIDEAKKVQGYQNWPGEKKKKFFQGPKDKSGKTETQKWAERKQKERETKQIDEKAPPGAKFERMVKHIKAGYAKDGLTKKEKSIAYATAWKAKKRETED